MAVLTLTIDFTIGDNGNKDRFVLGGSIKPEGAVTIIETWLHSVMGDGPDGSDENKLQTYHIEIDWRPSDDNLTIRSNCGNKGLRDGILMYVLKELTKDE
jgi:hypothetical protein